MPWALADVGLDYWGLISRLLPMTFLAAVVAFSLPLLRRAEGSAASSKAAKSQPVSVGMPQIGTQTLTESDMWGATLFDQLLCRIDFKGMRYEGLFTAPDTDTSPAFPGSLGGMNWGGISHDPNNDLIFMNDIRLGLWVRMVPASGRAALRWR